jgi:hypothetical protein
MEVNHPILKKDDEPIVTVWNALGTRKEQYPTTLEGISFKPVVTDQSYYIK